MLRKSFILTLLLCLSFAVPSFADTFLWPYNVPGIDASGTFLTAPLSSGTYVILEITGQRNGETITGLGDLGGANNLLYQAFPYFDIFGLAYIAGGTEFNLYGTVETGPFGQNPLLIETYLSSILPSTRSTPKFERSRLLGSKPFRSPRRWCWCVVG